MSDDPIQTAILTLVEAKGPGKSISPEDVAKAAYPDDWQTRLKAVRAMAVGLARKGQISLLRKGRPVDPETLKGVYRLSLPMERAAEAGPIAPSDG